jgi:hypothetical protein
MQPGSNGWKYTHLAGAGTTTVLNGVGATNGVPANTGILGGIEINTAGTTVTLYDSTTGSGSIIAVYGAVTGCFNLPKQLQNGLTVVIAGSADVTVCWQ